MENNNNLHSDYLQLDQNNMRFQLSECLRMGVFKIGITVDQGCKAQLEFCV